MCLSAGFYIIVNISLLIVDKAKISEIIWVSLLLHLNILSMYYIYSIQQQVQRVCSLHLSTSYLFSSWITKVKIYMMCVFKWYEFHLFYFIVLHFVIDLFYIIIHLLADRLISLETLISGSPQNQLCQLTLVVWSA